MKIKAINARAFTFLNLTLITLILSSCTPQSPQEQSLHTSSESVTIRVNGELRVSTWTLAPELKPDVFELECREAENLVSFSDGTDSIGFTVGLHDTIDFNITMHRGDTAQTRIIGIKPNVNFTPAYIDANRGKVNIEIPEVSELVNILVALHKDAEKDKNMTNSDTEYFKRVKAHFSPYLTHPIMDTVQKYIHGLRYDDSFQDSLFSRDSYNYYFALKMNACAYSIGQSDRIVNDGIIQQMAKGWHSFDPMKDAALMADFAKASNFRAFYEANKPHYDSLIVTYKQLNPIDQMQTWLEEEFGVSYGSYSVYFSPLVFGAHSTQNFGSGDFNQTFMFICPADYNDSYSPVMNELQESRVVFTEIDHNYVNPLSYEYLETINEVFGDRATWAKGEITNSYDSPYMVFNEYMTFGVYSLYLIDNYKEEVVMEFLPYMERQMEARRGFIRFGEFNRELLATYMENRDQPIKQLYEHMFDWARAKQSTEAG